MIENRPRGRDLAKKVSYGYVIIGILLSIISIALNTPEGAFALAQKGASFDLLILGTALYFVFAAIIYLLSTKYENDKVLWIIYIVIAILNFIVIGFSLILFVFSFFLVVAGNDIREELN